MSSASVVQCTSGKYANYESGVGPLQLNVVLQGMVGGKRINVLISVGGGNLGDNPIGNQDPNPVSVHIGVSNFPPPSGFSDIIDPAELGAGPFGNLTIDTAAGGHASGSINGKAFGGGEYAQGVSVSGLWKC
jgi:hypothetical protein